MVVGLAFCFYANVSTNQVNPVLNLLLVQQFVHAVGMGVGNKHLSEFVAAHQLEQPAETGSVEFVVNIIQQQQRRYIAATPDELKLRKP